MTGHDLLLGRAEQRLDFFVFSDDYRLTVASFYAAFPPENHLIEEYLCIPGVMDLGQVMRDAVR